MLSLLAILALAVLAGCGSDSSERARLDLRHARRGRVPGHDRAQVRQDHRRGRAQARRRRRPARAGLAAGARRRPRRHDRVVRRARGRDLPLGRGGSRRRARSRRSSSFTDGIQYEKVAALAPDLILAIYSGLNQKDYDTLSKIAPVVAQPPGQIDWGSSWQDEITMTGKAVGKSAEAEKLKATAEQQLADAAAANPEFKGQTGVVATPVPGHLRLRPAGRPLTPVDRPRLHVPRGAGEHRRQGVRRPALRREGRPARRRHPPVVRRARGRRPSSSRRPSTPSSTCASRAATSTSRRRARSTRRRPSSRVLSIPLLIDELVPKLAAAADGDPATTA